MPTNAPKTTMTPDQAARIIGSILSHLQTWIVEHSSKLIGTGYGAALEMPGLVVVIGDPKPDPEPKRRRARKRPR